MFSILPLCFLPSHFAPLMQALDSWVLLDWVLSVLPLTQKVWLFLNSFQSLSSRLSHSACLTILLKCVFNLQVQARSTAFLASSVAEGLLFLGGGGSGQTDLPSEDTCLSSQVPRLLLEAGLYGQVFTWSCCGTYMSRREGKENIFQLTKCLINMTWE